MDRRTLIMSSAALALGGCATTNADSYARAAEIDAAVEQAMRARGGGPGLAVAVYTRDGVYARGFGLADVSTGERANADTSFYIASSTKPLTALALAILQSRGELDLSSTLAAYAPDAPFPPVVRAGEVTFQHLLTHQSGIANDPITHRLAFSGQHDSQTLWRLLGASAVDPDAPLGTYAYANTGYNVATILTDHRLGVRWQDLLQREVFTPAGMTRSTASRSHANAAQWSLAKPHMVMEDGQAVRIYLEKVDATMQSAGGVLMSAADAVRWLELMVENGRVRGQQAAPPGVVEATRTPLAVVGENSEGYRREHYGLGWHIGPFGDDTLYHHFGGFAGARAHVSYLPSRGVGVAVFANDNSLDAPAVNIIANFVYDLHAGRSDARTTFDQALAAFGERRTQLLERFRQDVASRALRPWQLSRPLSAYAGAYQSDLYGPMEIIHDAGALQVRKGVLSCNATPFTRPDSMRLELVPGLGMVLQFEGTGERPSGCTLANMRFERV